MNHFKDQWIKYKISEMHPKDLIHYGTLYGVTISFEEAAKILEIVQNNPWSINDEASLYSLLSKVENIVSPQAFTVINKIFHDFIN